MGTDIRLRPLPQNGNKEECHSWHNRLSEIESFLKKEGAFLRQYSTGYKWVSEETSMKQLLEKFADAQGYELEWEGGTPSMFDVATLRYVPSPD